MAYGINKKDNVYARVVLDIDAPKTVWMAIAFSLAQRLTDDDQAAAHHLIIAEWQALYDNGIVPQRVRLNH